ncbi:hypothetical protein Ae201684P_020616 [Aphanomyces euteiches]|uniref:Uncharacterized protein n=1 Tax=Aphanomyces euteiches TaxID=100861 RepID=A0A6G0WHA7_9STRA|nr:hypothetical protein Ae201684_015178 [Aphanomyces euteiches]KAH9079989.1 hypothetical protein Ae201684P_020569 [Aphanomyces euteiches]KAH9080037.1 hypothetical protein Ae201684P_020616 [Aphanomyces euteiches]
MTRHSTICIIVVSNLTSPARPTSQDLPRDLSWSEVLFSFAMREARRSYTPCQEPTYCSRHPSTKPSLNFLGCYAPSRTGKIQELSTASQALVD